MEKLTLTMPLPPSVNRLTGNRTGGRGRYMTPEYRRWRKEAGWEVLAQIAGQALPIFPGRFELTITAPRRPRADCDNRAKAAADLLVSMGVVIDDRGEFMDAATTRWVDGRDDIAGCVVTITHTGDVASRTVNPRRQRRKTDSSGIASPKADSPATGKRRASHGLLKTQAAVRKKVLTALRRRGIVVSPERVHL